MVFVCIPIFPHQNNARVRPGPGWDSQLLQLHNVQKDSMTGHTRVPLEGHVNIAKDFNANVVNSSAKLARV